MLTVLSATNRPEAYTLKVAHHYIRTLGEKGIQHAFFSLEQMPQNLLNNGMYGAPRNADMVHLEQTLLIPTQKFVVVVPEYNGSFPGVLKAFIDASDVKNCWHNKKVCLVGVSDGRAGNLRGMEHLTNIFNHLKVNVLHLKIPISNVSAQFDGAGKLANQEIKSLIDQQIALFQDF
ncbi:MAG: NAD(P)H-dependent oxidoreductase [Chitinophagales bacterium]|nr:NAD(P)H-dependent oxidoreductase [Chitinophagales bacterium]